MEELKGSSALKFREYAYRWVVLFLFVFVSAVSGILAVTCAPITVQISNTYDVSILAVEMSMMISMFVFLVLVFPCNWFVDKFEIRRAVAVTQMDVGCVLVIIGAALRIGAMKSYWFVLAGNGLLSAGSPFISGLTAKISSFWFRVEWVHFTQRTNSTTIASVANSLGGALGMLIPTLFVTDNDKQQITNLMIFEAALAIVVCVAALILMRNKPKTAPSTTSVSKREDFAPAFCNIMQNVPFLIVLLISSMDLGVINIFLTVVQVVTNAYGFTSTDSGIFGMVLIIAGLVGCFTSSPILARTRKFRLMLILCAGVSFAGSLIFALTVSIGNMILSSFCVVLLGLGIYPIYAFCIELAVEVSYPVGEAMSTGLINSGGQIVGIAGTFITTALLSTPFAASFVMTAGMAITALGTIVVRERFARTAKDQRGATMLEEELGPGSEVSINNQKIIEESPA